jgi:hypothetical protein
MTIKAVMERGWTPRQVRGSASKIEWLQAQSYLRYWELRFVLEARALNLRTAHRRYKRRVGLPFGSVRVLA